jgi:hypothetical protein
MFDYLNSYECQYSNFVSFSLPLHVVVVKNVSSKIFHTSGPPWLHAGVMLILNCFIGTEREATLCYYIMIMILFKASVIGKYN